MKYSDENNLITPDFRLYCNGSNNIHIQAVPEVYVHNFLLLEILATEECNLTVILIPKLIRFHKI